MHSGLLISQGYLQPHYKDRPPVVELICTSAFAMNQVPEPQHKSALMQPHVRLRETLVNPLRRPRYVTQSKIALLKEVVNG